MVLTALRLWCRDDVENTFEAEMSMVGAGWEGESVGL